jgi:hypothetical protein
MCVRDFAAIDDVPVKVQTEKNTSNFNFEVEMNRAANSKSNNFEGEQQMVIKQMHKLGIDVFNYTDMTH